MMKTLLLLASAVLGLAGHVVAEHTATSASASEVAPADLQWWRDARFGMFIHWGPVALTGKEISWSRANSNHYAPPPGGGGATAVEVYDNLYKQFNPEKFNADEWVATAKEAGMRYIVLTAKHCDSFLLWDSKTDDYNIMNTPFGRDVVKELSTAAQKAGIPFCVYFCPGDWKDPDCRHPENNPRFVERMHAQLTELLTKYGRIPLIWFDFDGHPNPSRPEETATLVRKLQPGVILTNRLEAMHPDESHGRMGPWGDYATPEQFVGGYGDEVPWETCMTIGTQWSWKPNDPIKSLDHCLQVLVGTVGGDGNLLFNVGPRADGLIEPDQVARLKEMGAWLRKHGQAVYGTRGGPWHPTPSYASTRVKDAIYLHIYGKPAMPFKLPALPAKVKSAALLDGSTVAVEQSGAAFTVTVPQEKLDPSITVVKLTIEGAALALAPIPPPSTTGSLAYRKPATASSSVAPRYMHQASAAFDDNPHTLWSPGRDEEVANTLYGKSIHSVTPDRPLWLRESWLEVDLQEPKTVARMVLADGHAPVKEWKVEYEKGGTWHEAAKGSTIGQNLEVKLPESVTAQKFRLSLRADNRTAIREWQMF